MRNASLVTAFLSALLLVSLVAAIGTSTGGNKPPSNPPPQTTPEPTIAVETNTVAHVNVAPCENGTTVHDRILCRIQQKQTIPTAEESCRGLANAAGCLSLYQSSEVCYTKTGTEKDSCFKHVIGFSHSSVRDEASANQANARSYIVLLLYDLQERAEDANTAGTITDAQAADIVTDIVAAKQTILQGKSKADIITALATIKVDWKVAFS